jgi:hypothetical protein
MTDKVQTIFSGIRKMGCCGGAPRRQRSYQSSYQRNTNNNSVFATNPDTEWRQMNQASSCNQSDMDYKSESRKKLEQDYGLELGGSNNMEYVIEEYVEDKKSAKVTKVSVPSRKITGKK